MGADGPDKFAELDTSIVPELTCVPAAYVLDPLSTSVPLPVIKTFKPVFTPGV